MARFHEKQIAIKLRKQGKTYSEIRATLQVPKSTLSNWLSKYPLTSSQMARLEKRRKKNKDLSIERFRATMQKKRKKRLSFLYKEEKKRWVQLSKRELELAGVFLYWGEGNKSLKGSLSINNTDPQVVKFTLYWLKHALKIPEVKIKVYLHLYKDMNVNQEIAFWSHMLQIPLSQFSKPYIKESKRAGVTHKGYGHGTCGLVVHDIRLKERVLMSIKAIADYYQKRLSLI